MANILELIDKNDNFELIRDELAAILAIEVANQKALAVTAGKDPALWDFAVYLERSAPWNLFFDNNNEIIKRPPLVNVYFDSMAQTDGESNQINTSKYTGQFMIDALSAKNDKMDTVGSDHEWGDELAAKDVHRISKLCRNILMAGIYKNIFTSTENGVPVSVPGIVSRRVFSQIQTFKPDLNDRPDANVIGARLTLNIDFVEFSPQYDGVELELISSQCKRGEDGSVYFDTLFDTTP